MIVFLCPETGAHVRGKVRLTWSASAVHSEIGLGHGSKGCSEGLQPWV